VGTAEAGQFLYPWLFICVFLPLAHWCDSRTLMYCSIAGLLFAIATLLGDSGSVGFTIEFALAALALWCWAGWQESHLPTNQSPGFLQPPMRPDQDALHNALAPRVLAVLGVLLLLHFWSFKDAGHVTTRVINYLLTMPWQNLVSLLALVVGASSSWILTFRQQANRGAHVAFGVTIAALIAMVALSNRAVPVHLAANLLALAVELGLAWVGLMQADRRWFWLGLLGLTAQVTLRFFEYDTDLVAKSIVFTVWGLTLLGAGWGFERAVARRAASNSRSAMEER
jgi:hypothetical protein